MKSKRKKNSIRKRAQNPASNSLNDLIGPTHSQQKQRNKQLKTSWSTIMTSRKTKIYIGLNTEYKVKPTPRDDKAKYSKNLPMPIHLKKELSVELALMHKNGIVTVLPFSNYASPIFAQRKPNGKLRLPLDLNKIISLIPDDYTNNNRPVSTLSDAAQHLTGKSQFCKLDWPQASHCLQMEDHWSAAMLAFNFAS